MIHHATTTLGETTAIAGMNIVVDLSDDGDVLLKVETPHPSESDAKLLEEFARFHRANPDVLEEFLAKCRCQISQRLRPKARFILVQIRRQRCQRHGRGFLPLKNQYSAFYAALAREQGLWVASDTEVDEVLEAIRDM